MFFSPKPYDRWGCREGAKAIILRSVGYSDSLIYRSIHCNGVINEVLWAGAISPFLDSLIEVFKVVSESTVIQWRRAIDAKYHPQFICPLIPTLLDYLFSPNLTREQEFRHICSRYEKGLDMIEKSLRIVTWEDPLIGSQRKFALLPDFREEYELLEFIHGPMYQKNS